MIVGRTKPVVKPMLGKLYQRASCAVRNLEQKKKARQSIDYALIYNELVRALGEMN